MMKRKYDDCFLFADVLSSADVHQMILKNMRSGEKKITKENCKKIIQIADDLFMKEVRRINLENDKREEKK